jgi:hypothetical protein
MLMMMMMDRPDSTTVLSYGHHQRPQQQQHHVHNLQQPVPGTSTSAAAAISAPLLFSGLDAFGDNLTQVNKKCKLKKNLSLDRRNAQIFSLSLSLSLSLSSLHGSGVSSSLQLDSYNKIPHSLY